MNTFITILKDTEGIVTKFRFAFVDISLPQVIRLARCTDIESIDVIDELTGEVMFYSNDKEFYVAPDWDKFFWEQWLEIE